jgi:cytochrome c oxidase cbb3-type subunit 3
MAERESDEAAGAPTTGHEWDGIRELDTPLPRWWLIVFYATIAFSIVYWVLMPAWPLLTGNTPGVLHYSERAKVMQDLAALKAQRAAEGAKLQSASLEQIEKDPAMSAYALQVGQSIFSDNCAPCHGPGGLGGRGYPNLRAGVWMWGGSLEDIQRTITYGVRSGDPNARVSQMPAFGRDGILQPAQVDDLTEYVVSLSHRPANAAAVARGAPLYAANCAICHGLDGTGNQQVGAPNLADAGRQWLYGSDRASIHDQIWNGHGGVMPAWGHRFDPNTIKALAVYIHANAGGQ